jgi:hypothetical protein
MKQHLVAGLVILLLLISGCAPDPGALSPTLDAPTSTLEPTAAPSPTPTPTIIPIAFTQFRHRSGVFGLSIPEGWETLDSSTEQRLQVRFIPPPGFGSRVTVEATNTGILTPDQLQERVNSYIDSIYAGSVAYVEQSRGNASDGALQIDYAYNDGKGATGTERLLTKQSGPYLLFMRLFLATPDAQVLAPILDQIQISMTIDPEVVWGTTVAAINPAELLIVNTFLWQEAQGKTNYAGEIYNASPSAIKNAHIKAAICDSNGIVITEVSQSAGVKVIEKESSAPFLIVLESMPRGVVVCSEQGSAEPAGSDPAYTSALIVDATGSLNRAGRLQVQGTITNPTLASVQNVHVVISVYNNEGRVVGFTEINSEPGVILQPGQALPFAYVFERLGGRGDRFNTYVEAQIVSDSNPSLSP